MSDDFLVLDTPDANGVTDEQNDATKGRLRSFLDRIERLEAEEQEKRDDKKLIYAEAKGEGFDTKAVRKLVKLRKKDKQTREQEEAVLDLYIASIGGLD